MARQKNKAKSAVVAHGKGEGEYTIKQRKFIAGVAVHGNGTQAVIDAGYNVKNRNVASAVASEMLSKPKIQQGIEDTLNKAGLTETKVSELLQEAIVSGVGRDSRNSDALRGIDMYYKLLGKYAPKRLEKATVALKLSGESSSQLREQLDKQSKAIEELKDLMK